MTKEIEIMERNYKNAVKAIQDNKAVFSEETIESMHNDIMNLKAEIKEAHDKQAKENAKQAPKQKAKVIKSKRGQSFLYETYFPNGEVRERRSKKDSYEFAVICQSEHKPADAWFVSFSSRYDLALTNVESKNGDYNTQIVKVHEMSAQEAKVFRRASK